MESKHTKGNWIAKQTSQGGVLDIIVDDKGWTDYGKIWVASTISVNKSQEECEANAKLIALAPEMLSALQLYVAGLLSVSDATNVFNIIIKKATES